MSYEEKQKELIKLCINQKKYPRYLFRYVKIDDNGYLLDSLKNHYLWFSALKDFNDPFEGKLQYPASYSKEDITSYLVKHNCPQQMINNVLLNVNPVKGIVENEIQKKIESIRVCCFSKEGDDILQWAYYGDAHKGVCLKFDILASLDTFVSLHPIKYRTDYPTSNYLKDEYETITNMCITKSDKWIKENEMRIVKLSLSGNKVPYTPSSLVEIIFGCKQFDNNIINSVKDAAIAANPAVKFKKCEINPKSYTLDIKSL